MKTRWMICLLLLLLVSCSNNPETEVAITQTAPIPATAEPTPVEPSPIPPTDDGPTSTVEDPPAPTATQPLPAPTTSNQVVVPTQLQIIPENPSAIIARVEGGPSSFLLVGGSHLDNWISARDVADSLSVDTEYQLHSAIEDLGWITGQSITHEHICDQYFVKAGPFFYDQSAIGVAGQWPLRPRTHVEIPIDNEIYLTAVAAWQVEQAPSMPIAAIKKIWKVDVEGNGTDEVFINATRFAEPTGHNVEPRDYSVVLMRTVVGSEVATIELVGDYYSEAGVNQFPLTYNLEFIGDLNGDDKMEVVVGVSRWEGTGVMIFEIDVDQVQLVLSVMCSL